MHQRVLTVFMRTWNLLSPDYESNSGKRLHVSKGDTSGKPDRKTRGCWMEMQHIWSTFVPEFRNIIQGTVLFEIFVLVYSCSLCISTCLYAENYGSLLKKIPNWDHTYSKKEWDWKNVPLSSNSLLINSMTHFTFLFSDGQFKHKMICFIGKSTICLFCIRHFGWACD